MSDDRTRWTAFVTARLDDTEQRDVLRAAYAPSFGRVTDLVRRLRLTGRTG